MKESNRLDLMEDEIDLRRYAQIVAKRWTTVRDAVILAALAALVATMVSASPSVTTYEAVARLTAAKTMMQVVLEDKIKTLSPETAAAQASTPARRNTLASLVKNPRVAEEVIQKLGDRLPAGLRNADALVGMVEGRASKDADIVEIAVRGTDPTLVVEIANAWAAAYERQVNGLYSGSGTSNVSIENELANARQQYEKASEALTSFTGDNRILELTLLIEDRKEQLNNLYATRLKLEQLLENAQLIRATLNRPGASASDISLALQLLKAQLASSGYKPPSTAQIQVPAPASPASTSAQAAELEALIAALEARLKEYAEAIDHHSASVLDSGASAASQSAIGATIDRLNKEVLQLEAELSRENARKQDLTLDRDLAWQVYSSLARKAEEVALASRLPGSEVTFAAPATAAQAQTSGRRLSPSVTVALAAFVGLMVGVLGVFAMEYFSPEAPNVAIPWTAPLRWAWQRVRGQHREQKPAQQRDS